MRLLTRLSTAIATQNCLPAACAGPHAPPLSLSPPSVRLPSFLPSFTPSPPPSLLPFFFFCPSFLPSFLPFCLSLHTLLLLLCPTPSPLPLQARLFLRSPTLNKKARPHFNLRTRCPRKRKVQVNHLFTLMDFHLLFFLNFPHI